MPKYSILIAQFPYGGSTRQTVSDWVVATVLRMKKDPRVAEIHHKNYNDTPIPMTRNKACKDALELGADVCLMIDNDMSPDLPYPGAVPFWDAAFDFAVNHHGPCLIGAPYCGPPPVENVYLFHWTNLQSDCPDANFRLEQYTREEAACMGGIQEVAALPTGLFLFHTAALQHIDPPWFDYEYTDEYRTSKASTEDVYFSRNLSLAGVPNYCAWDSWAGHWKQKCVGKPQPLTPDAVGVSLRRALERPPSNERLVEVPEGGFGMHNGRQGGPKACAGAS